MNSWQFSQLKFALGIGGLMSFYGIVGAVTYFGGEKLGLPLNTRIVVIILLLLTMPFSLLLSWYVSRRGKKKEEAEKKAAEEAKAAPEAQAAVKTAAPTGNFEALPQGAEEVVKFLRSSNLGTAGEDALYSLPWYLVAGVPKSGKSSAVVASNLNFQTLPSQRQSEQKIIRPTGGVEWRVTTDAVFIDTSGRFQTEGGDAEEWSALLETIRKSRPNRPLDGVILVVDSDRVLSADERQIEESAKVMRARLDDAMQRIKLRFPVYLVFNHADAIEGFKDSFSTSKKEGENLVWGATIPLEKSENAHAMFDDEFALLQDSVMKRRLMRLSAPFPPVRQLRIFNFPLHFGAARRNFGAFVTALFRPNPFTDNPFFRGFYFTATPGSKGAPDAPATVAAGFFVEKLFREVILRDKDLVRTFQQQRQRPPILGWLVTLICAAITLVLLILAGVSTVSNKQLLEMSSDRALAVMNNARADVNRDPLTKSADESSAEINALEELRLLMVKLDDYDRNRPPIYLRMGLYSGNRIYKEKLLPIYYTAVSRRFMDPTRRRMEEEMRKFVAGPPVKNPKQLSTEEEEFLGKNYDLLKAYLMLTPNYQDKATENDVFNVLKTHWFEASKLPERLRDDAENQLKFYARQVDRIEGDDRFPRFQPTADLVAQMREKLLAFPPEQRYYRRKVTEISKDVDAKTIMSVDAILQREGSPTGIVEGSYIVPGAYTIQGFKEMEKAIAVSTAELAGCDWVIEEKCGTLKSTQQVIESPNAGKIRDRYFRDYSDHWKNFAKGIKVKPFRKENSTESGRVSAKDALSALSSASSPIKILLTEISKNTNLATPPALGWWDSIKGWFSSESLPTTGADSQVVRDFLPLTTFVRNDSKDKKSPIDEYGAVLETVSGKYATVVDDNRIPELTAKPEEERNKELNLTNATTTVNNSTKSFSKDLPFIADLLKQPLENLKSLFGADTIKQIAEQWKLEVVPVARKAEVGFPFDESESNADFANLREYMAKGKGLTKFYDEKLKRYFDGTPGQLKLKDPANAPFNQEFVDYLNKALTLRQSLFSKGDDVKFTYNFELLNPNEAVVEVTIDGVIISSVDKPSGPIDFPAASGGGSGVIIKVISSGSTTSTSGTTSSANTSNSSVSSSSNTATKPTGGSGDEKPFLGPWGLFRFMIAAGMQKQSDNSYRLSYRLRNGKLLEAKVTPSGVDPFSREIYKLRAPENILR